MPGKTFASQYSFFQQVQLKHIFEQHPILPWSVLVAFVVMLSVILGLILSIRSRRKIERELFASQQRMELALSSGELGTWDWDIVSGKAIFDERWTGVLGYTQSEVEPCYQSWERLIHPDDKANVMKALNAHLSGQADGYEAELRMRHKDGHWVWILTKGRVIQRDEKGNPLRACGLHLNITERKKTEEILRLTQFSIDHINSGALWVNSEGEIIYANNASVTSNGYSRKELLNMTVFELDPDFPESNWENYKKELRRLKTMRFESRHRRKDGSFFPVEVNAHYIEYEGQFFSAAFDQDITERKRAEKELEESDSRYMDILRSSADPVMILDNTGFIDCNDATLQMFGYTSRDEVLHTKPADHSPPMQPGGQSSQQKADEMIHQALENGYHRFIWMIKHRNGECHPIEVSLTPIVYKGNTLVYSACRDITELKRAEEELHLNLRRTQALLQLGQMSEAPLKEITDFALEKVVELTKSQIGYLAFMNDDETVLTMHSWSKTAMKECRVQDKPIIYPVVNTGLWGEAVRQRKPVITNDYRKFNPMKKGYPEGHVPILRHMNAPIFSGNKIVLVAGVGNKQEEYTENDVNQMTLVMQAMWRLVERIREVKEREKLQEQLSQAQKMESIGRLAGGLAHDFNNMLGGIMGGAELLRQVIPRAEKSDEYLDIILKSANRAADLTGKLLSFARRDTTDKMTLDIHQVLNDVILILMNTVDKRITIQTDFSAPMPLVQGDASQLQSAFLNLGINASHAMPAGGTLSYLTRIVDLSPDYCESSTFDLSPGNFIEIEVRDTGNGIARENLPHIFEPFFTTKEQGQGTGLGLTVTYGTIQRHKGAISVYSDEKQGTVFRILLPLTQEASELLPPPEADVRGKGLVLLVDDEEIMRVTGKALLEKYGYTVMLAEHGQEALELYQQHYDKIDLVILDMMMPVMNGRDCFMELRKRWPNARILLSSGFTRSEDLNDLKNMGLNGYISKPFQGGNFSRIVAQALGNATPPDTFPA